MDEIFHSDTEEGEPGHREVVNLDSDILDTV